MTRSQNRAQGLLVSIPTASSYARLFMTNLVVHTARAALISKLGQRVSAASTATFSLAPASAAWSCAASMINTLSPHSPTFYTKAGDTATIATMPHVCTWIEFRPPESELLFEINNEHPAHPSRQKWIDAICPLVEAPGFYNACWSRIRERPDTVVLCTRTLRGLLHALFSAGRPKSED